MSLGKRHAKDGSIYSVACLKIIIITLMDIKVDILNRAQRFSHVPFIRKLNKIAYSKKDRKHKINVPI